MKIVWAVDPLNTKVPFASLSRLLASFGAERPAIEAVYVAGERQRIRAITDRSCAEERLAKTLGRAHIDVPATVLWDTSGSHRTQVEELLHHAIHVNANLVAIFSHGRRGIERLYKGSFAESVADRSPLPVLLANPATRLPKRIKRILFATDFSLASQKAFTHLLTWAAEASWQLGVFHAADPYRLGTPHTMQYSRNLRRKIQRVQKQAAAAGVDALVINDNRFKPVFELILEEAAQNHSDLICVASQKNKWRHLLLGSVTRQLIRESEIPLLVLKA